MKITDVALVWLTVSCVRTLGLALDVILAMVSTLLVLSVRWKRKHVSAIFANPLFVRRAPFIRDPLKARRYSMTGDADAGQAISDLSRRTRYKDN